MKKIALILISLSYLKPKQLLYLIYYRIIRKNNILPYKATDLKHTTKSLSLTGSISTPKSIIADKTFQFLTISHQFTGNIDWNFSENGKLWTYNLNYFDFLQQTKISIQEGEELIHDYINQLDKIKDGLEPYCTSLRGINWIKFIAKHNIQDTAIDAALFEQYCILNKSIEYHISGNHLLENGLSLLHASYYFNDKKFYKKAHTIITEEISSQILNDGAHFELSPMYHQIILFRILDCINLVQNNNLFNSNLQEILEVTAARMLDWLNKISFKNGSIPLFNDSSNSIAPNTLELQTYARSLNIQKENNPLSDSNYYKFSEGKFEFVFKTGNISANHQPGHTHNDCLSFELTIDSKPVIVNTGTSTYENTLRRTIERSTASHNTITVGDYEQNQIWEAFRIAKRGLTVSKSEEDNYSEAQFTNYNNNYSHLRSIEFSKNNITIYDTVESKQTKTTKALFHFHPDIIVNINNNQIEGKDFKIQFTEGSQIKHRSYQYALGFNNLIEASLVEIEFKNTLTSHIQIY